MTATPERERTRAQIPQRTLRVDNWLAQPIVTASILSAFIVYAAYVILANDHYASGPYLSPFYSPNLTDVGMHGWGWVSWPAWITPSILIIWIPMGFRFTCYYYRKAYYRAFWQSPTACAVSEPHKKYTGESKFPLVFIQNMHRYFFWLAALLNVVLTYDAVIAFRDYDGRWGHMGLGTVVLIVNAALLWMYTLSCHACRHAIGGRLKHFSNHPIRYRLWTWVSRINPHHQRMAWISLIWVAFTDVYVRLLSMGVISDLRFF
ncbi:hypothetical protein [Nocardia heshunensis]